MDIIIELIREWWFALLAGAITCVEIAPIKINPLSKVFRWFGKMIMVEVKGELRELKDEMLTFKREQEAKNANDMRWAIINFANSCHRGELHSKDAWRHVLNQISEYEKYTKEKNIVNGVVDAESEYLRQLYEERCWKNDFIK